jgi:hypothetical protein
VKVGGIFDSSQGSRKQKPQPELTGARFITCRAPLGASAFRPMFSGKSIANVRPRRIQCRRARSLSARCHILANPPAPISSGAAIEGKSGCYRQRLLCAIFAGAVETIMRQPHERPSVSRAATIAWSFAYPGTGPRTTIRFDDTAVRTND